MEEEKTFFNLITHSLNKRNLKSFLVSYMSDFELQHPEIRYADEFWGRFFDKINFNEIHIPDPVLLKLVSKAPLIERKRFKNFVQNNSVYFSKFLDDVMLCIKTIMLTKNHLLSQKIFDLFDLFNDVKIFYPYLSEAFFKKALNKLVYSEDIGFVDEGVILHIVDNYEHNEHVFFVAYKCCLYSIMVEGNKKGLSKEFLLDLIGKQGFNFYDAKTAFDKLVFEGHLDMNEEDRLVLTNKEYDLAYFNSLEAKSFFFDFSKPKEVVDFMDLDSMIKEQRMKMPLTLAQKNYLEKPGDYDKMVFCNKLLQILRSANSPESAVSEDDIFTALDINVSDEAFFRDILVHLDGIGIVIKKHQDAYYLVTNMNDWCLNKARGGLVN